MYVIFDVAPHLKLKQIDETIDTRISLDLELRFYLHFFSIKNQKLAIFLVLATNL